MGLWDSERLAERVAVGVLDGVWLRLPIASSQAITTNPVPPMGPVYG